VTTKDAGQSFCEMDRNTMNSPPTANPPRTFAFQPTHRRVTVGLWFIAAISPVVAHATVYHCVAPDGTSTYSDAPCTSTSQPRDPSPPSSMAPSNGSVGAVPPPMLIGHGAVTIIDGKEAKAAELLELLRPTSHAIDPSAASTLNAKLLAAYLVRQLDPANPAWTPQNPKWSPLLDLVTSDIRNDVQLSNTAAGVAQATAREYAAHADEVDIDALLQYLHSPQGVRYVEFQIALNSIYIDATKSLMQQQPVPADQPDETTLKERMQLLALSTIIRAQAADPGARPDVAAVGPTLLQNAAVREGVELGALSHKYERDLPGFISLTQSALGRRYFAAYGTALRTETAVSSRLTKDFAAAEESKYQSRWRKAYGITPASPANGPPTTLTAAPRMAPPGATGPAELAAMQCESDANQKYVLSHKPLPDTATQIAAMVVMRDKCRADLKLPPM
jgi:hypothetical protein